MEEEKNMAPIECEGFNTLTKLFRHRTHHWARQVAMREKDLGLWKSLTWQDYGLRVKEIALALHCLGLKPGDCCAIISENNKEWPITDMAVMTIRGITCGIYPTSSPKQMLYILNDSRARFLFVEDEEQLDKALEILPDTPQIKKIIVFDPRHLANFKHAKVLSFKAFADQGDQYFKQYPHLWDQSIDESKPQHITTLIYTSGTTGPPKGAMITHENALFEMQAMALKFPIYAGDEQISFLPLCHIAERLASILWPLKCGSIINFLESPETFLENIREISPTVLLAVPRVWEKFYSQINILLKDASGFEGFIFKKSLKMGLSIFEQEEDASSPKWGNRLKRLLLDKVLLKNVKEALGLNRLRWALTGAAPISGDLIRWYHGIGIKLYEVYGQTENCGLATGNDATDFKIGSVGRALVGTSMKLSPQGEILLKGPHIFKGYINQPEMTAKTLQKGWLHTGDQGEIDHDGHLKITGRIKDIIITAGGKNISPSEIENQLKVSFYITDAVVIGDRRAYLTCLIMIEQENVMKYAQDEKISFSTFQDLCHHKKIISLIGLEIKNVNKGLSRVETLKKFRLIDQQLMPEDEELTPTMKLKRQFVYQKYKGIINEMYQSH